MFIFLEILGIILIQRFSGTWLTWFSESILDMSNRLFTWHILNFVVQGKTKRGKTSAIFIALNQFILLPYHLVSFWQYIRFNISRQGNITVSNDPLISNKVYLVLLFLWLVYVFKTMQIQFVLCVKLVHCLTKVQNLMIHFFNYRLFSVKL